LYVGQSKYLDVVEDCIQVSTCILEELAARNSWLLVRWHKKRGLYSPLADP
jgi:hypothetical protein